MSKTQKIILYIGISFLGLALVLVIVNLFLKTKTGTEAEGVSSNTNLFSLFERPANSNKNTADTEELKQEGASDGAQNQEEQNSQQFSNIRQISNNPAINFIPIEKEVQQISFTPDTKLPQVKTKKYGVRYIGLNGLVYEKYDEESEATISNTISQRLGEAFIYKNFIVYRYSREDMQTVETFLGSISNKEGSVGAVNGSYLAKNIRSFALNENSGAYTFLLSDESRTSAQIILGNIEKNQSKTITKTSFTDWLIDFVDNNTLSLTSRPSELVKGSFYTLNTQTGLIKKIFSADGLTTKGLPFGAGVIMSYISSNSYQTGLYSNNSIIYTPFKTISDKCTATSKNLIVCAVPRRGGYPPIDDWYKGEFNYSDMVISYDINTGSQKIIYNGDTTIDVDIIKSSADGKSIIFRNKINGYLYKITLN